MSDDVRLPDPVDVTAPSVVPLTVSGPERAVEITAPLDGPTLRLVTDDAVDSRSAERREEERLVRSAQDGDQVAFGELVRRHQRRAYAVARSIVLSHDDAEDAVQDAFLHAFRALDRFRPHQPFGAWLHRIVSNAALDLSRRRKVRDADELPPTLAAGGIADPAEHAELKARLQDGLAALPARQRSVIVLHDVEGYKHSEISAMLGIPEGTARSDLHHARATLRRALRLIRRAD
jgi:RNA polymerase sigma-70 factor, ECF subfamily